jgi:hypothetical protein
MWWSNAFHSYLGKNLFFFSFWWNWCLNSVLNTCYTGALPFETNSLFLSPHFFVALVISFWIVSLLPRANLEPPSSYLCFLHSRDQSCHLPCSACWVRWGLTNFFPAWPQTTMLLISPLSSFWSYATMIIPGKIAFNVYLIHSIVNKLCDWAFCDSERHLNI